MDYLVRYFTISKQTQIFFLSLVKQSLYQLTAKTRFSISDLLRIKFPRRVIIVNFFPTAIFDDSLKIFYIFFIKVFFRNIVFILILRIHLFHRCFISFMMFLRQILRYIYSSFSLTICLFRDTSFEDSSCFLFYKLFSPIFYFRSVLTDTFVIY